MSASAGTCNAQLEEHEPGVVPQSRGRNRIEDGASDDLIGQNTLKTAIQNSLPLSELGTLLYKVLRPQHQRDAVPPLGFNGRAQSSMDPPPPPPEARERFAYRVVAL
ncbi:hypothetical protein CSPX01_03819 [Colletotrichum filicis]|nr:hypothetical protein CSPX01_03819 [Colletotrichum filicis]